MATVDKTAGAVHVHAGARGISKIERTIDFARDPVSASDVVQALNVYAGWYVHRVFLEVITPEGSAGNTDVGDGADPDGYLVDADINAAGFTAQALTLTEGTPNTVAGYTNGKLYAADDTIDLVPSIDLDAAKVRVVALVSQV